MASFGEELKRERELRDISLKEIAEATKISIRFLEALECNNFDILPGGIFNRGFIRAYARFIGVDGEEMVNSYLHELSMQEKRKSRQGGGPADRPGAAPATARATKPTAPQEGFFRPERKASRPVPQPAGVVTGIEEVEKFKPKLPEGNASGWSSTLIWAAVVITLLIGAAAVTLNQLGSGEEDPVSEVAGARSTSRPQEASTGPPPTRTGASSEEPAETVVDPDPEPVAGQPVRKPPEPNEPSEPPEPEPVVGNTRPEPVQEPEPVPVQEPVRPAGRSLWVRATEFNYIRIECADGVALDQELLPNQSRTVTCIPPGRISALNAGALQYSVDGGPQQLLGEMGSRVQGVTVIALPGEESRETARQ